MSSCVLCNAPRIHVLTEKNEWLYLDARPCVDGEWTIEPMGLKGSQLVAYPAGRGTQSMFEPVLYLEHRKLCTGEKVTKKPKLAHPPLHLDNTPWTDDEIAEELNRGRETGQDHDDTEA